MKKTLLIIILLICFSLPLRGTLAQSGAEVGVFKDYNIAPGSRIEIPIEIRGVQDLYAIDLELQFDPTVLEAEDADPQMEGIQPALGTFLDAGLLLFNTIDPETGLVRFVMSQVNPSEPKSGDGILLVLYLTAKTVGESDLTVKSVTLSDRAGMEISASAVDAVVTVAEGAPVIVSTSIPVQDPTGMIFVPTLVPTAIPTQTPIPTQMPAPTATAMPEPTNTQEAAMAEAQPTEVNVQNADGENEDKDGFSLRQNWWIILLVALLVGAGLVYLPLSRRKHAVSSQEKPSAPPENE